MLLLLILLLLIRGPALHPHFHDDCTPLMTHGLDGHRERRPPALLVRPALLSSMMMDVPVRVIDLMLRSVRLIRLLIVFDGVGARSQAITSKRRLQLTPSSSTASDHESKFGVPVGSVQRDVGQEVDGC